MIQTIILVAMLALGIVNLYLTVHYWRLFLKTDKEQVKAESKKEYLMYDGR